MQKNTLFCKSLVGIRAKKERDCVLNRTKGKKEKTPFLVGLWLKKIKNAEKTHL